MTNVKPIHSIVVSPASSFNETGPSRRFAIAYDTVHPDIQVRFFAIDGENGVLLNAEFLVQMIKNAVGENATVQSFAVTGVGKCATFQIPPDCGVDLYDYTMTVQSPPPSAEGEPDNSEQVVSAVVQFAALGRPVPEFEQVDPNKDPTFLAGEVTRAISAAAEALSQMNGQLETMTSRLGEVVQTSTGAVEASQRSERATMQELTVVQTANADYRRHLTDLATSVKGTLEALNTAFEESVANKVMGVPAALKSIQEQADRLNTLLQPIIDRMPAHEAAIDAIRTATGTTAETVSNLPGWMKTLIDQVTAMNTLLDAYSPAKIGETFRPLLDVLEGVRAKQGKLPDEVAGKVATTLEPVVEGLTAIKGQQEQLPETVAELVAKKNAADLQAFTEVLKVLTTLIEEHPAKVSDEVAAKIKTALETINDQMRKSYGLIDEKFIAVKTAVESLTKLLDPTKLGAELAPVVRDALTTIQAESARQVEAIRRGYDDALAASKLESAEQIKAFRAAHAEATRLLIAAIGTAQDADAESRKRHLAEVEQAFQSALGRAQTTNAKKPETTEPKKHIAKKRTNKIAIVIGIVATGGAIIGIVWGAVAAYSHIFLH